MIFSFWEQQVSPLLLMVLPSCLSLSLLGFTGKLVTRYLYAHPRFRSQFSFAVGARSPKKLDELAEELSLDKEVKRVQVDVTENNSLLPAVQASKVVINTVGPYWKWGTPVVRCVTLLHL
jgi:short subunit dehydrogenase-like uncharacterized protein